MIIFSLRFAVVASEVMTKTGCALVLAGVEDPVAFAEDVEETGLGLGVT